MPKSEKIEPKQPKNHATENPKSNAGKAVDPALLKALLDVEHGGKSPSENEFAYGGELGEIRDIQVRNAQGQEATVLVSGELFSVRFAVHAHESIVEPIYAMTIRDSKGQQIFGHNTLFERTPTRDLREGDKVEVLFRQSVNLGAGDYLISLGLTRFEGERLQVIHRRYDVVEIKVINEDGSIGIANCFSTIQFKANHGSD